MSAADGPHTPGPWTADVAATGTPACYEVDIYEESAPAGDKLVATIFGSEPEVALARARSIVTLAAENKRLREAATDALFQWEHHADAGESDLEVWKALRAALAD